MNEAELAAQVVAHLEREGWDVYQSLVKWIEAGKVDGVRIGREGRVVRLYPLAQDDR